MKHVVCLQNDDEGPAKGAQCPLSSLHVQPDLCDSELSDCESYVSLRDPVLLLQTLCLPVPG
jgi:hypothetical protein